MVKTTYYRYECLICGYVITRSSDCGEMECPACKREKEFRDGEGNLTIVKLQEEVIGLRNRIFFLEEKISLDSFKH